MTQIETLQEIVEDICKENKLFLVELEYKGDKNNPLIQVFADSEKGISVGECETVSRAIQDEIDFNDQFPEKYRLDVSSPGLDKPLIHNFQFTKNLNKQLTVKIEAEKGHEEKNGALKAFDAQFLTLLDKKENEVTIERSKIIEAKVKLQW